MKKFMKKQFLVLMTVVMVVPVMLFLAACGSKDETDITPIIETNEVKTYTFQNLKINEKVVTLPNFDASPVLKPFKFSEPEYYCIFDVSLFNKEVWIREYRENTGECETDAENAYTNAVGEVKQNFVETYKSDKSVDTEAALAAYDTALLKVKAYQKEYDKYQNYLVSYFEAYDKWEEDCAKKINTALENAGISFTVGNCYAGHVVNLLTQLRAMKIVTDGNQIDFQGSNFYFSRRYIVNSNSQIILNGTVISDEDNLELIYNRNQIIINADFEKALIAVTYNLQ